jgi:hypothetical protein
VHVPGQYSAKVNIAASGDSADLSKTVTATGYIHTRGYFYFTSLPAGDINLISLYNSTSGYGSSETAVYYSNATSKLAVYRDATGGTSVDTSSNLTTNMWNQVDLYMTVGSGTSGSYQVYLNGQLIANVTGTNTGSVNVDRVIFGDKATNGATSGTYWMDDVYADAGLAVGTASVNLSNNLQVGGNTILTGGFIQQTAVNSITAFQVLSKAGNSVFNIDTTNQKIGIGTAAPGFQLEVEGNGNTSFIVLDDTNGTYQDNVGLFNNGDLFAIRDETGNADLLTIGLGGTVTQGNVGIGTSTPTDLLHVYSTANTGHFINIDAQGTGTGQQAGLQLLTLGDGAKTLGVAGTKGWQFFGRGNAYTSAFEQNDFGISYYNGTSWFDPFRIDSATMRIGVGDSSPSFAIDVATSDGDIRLYDTDASATNHGYTIDHHSGGELSFNIVNTSDVVGSDVFTLWSNGSATFQSYANSATAFEIKNVTGTDLFAADTSNMIIKSAGDINVGSNFGSRLFSDSFESGNLNLWDQATFSGGSSAAIDTATVRNGKYSTKIVKANGTTANVYKNITSSSTVYARAYVNVTSTTSTINLMSIDTATTGFALYRDSSDGSLRFWNGPASVGTTTGQVLTTGSWHLIEMRVVVSATVGQVQVWLDGTRYINTAANQNTGSSNIIKLIMGEAGSGTNTGTFYLDDVMADATINASTVSASASVDESFHVGGTSTFSNNVQVDGNLSVTSSTYPPGRFIRTGSNTNDFRSGLAVQYRTSGDMASGFGPNIAFEIQDNAGVANEIGDIGFIRDGGDNSGTFVVTTIRSGGSNNSLTVDSNGAATFQNANNTTSAFRILQSSGTNDVLLTADTSNNRIIVGNSTGTGTATTVLVLDKATSAPTGVAGALYYDSTNNRFMCHNGTTWKDCAGGLSGTERVRLSPEFPGGTLSADGSSNSGTMFADYDATNRKNYYEWNSSQASAQDYDIIVSTMIPSNYVSGFTGFNIYGWRDNNTNASATITIEKEDGTSCLASTAITFSGSTSTWAESPHSISCTPAANEILIIKIKVSSVSSAKVRIGAIRYDYTK